MKNKVFTSLIILALSFIGANALAAGDAANGETLSASCVACHGADGNSPSPMFPKIAGLGEKYLFKQLGDIQSGVRAIPEMVGQLDNKSEQDLADLAAYFASNATQLAGAKDADLLLNSGATVSALKLGEKIYRAGNAEVGVPACTGCHSLNT